MDKVLKKMYQRLRDLFDQNTSRNLGHIFLPTAVAHLRLERGDGGGAARGGGVAHDAGH